MKTSKIKKLKRKGWKIGSAADFLGLSKDEAAFVKTKLALAECLKGKRLGKNYSQTDFASQLQSSQSRVAKMERGDASVSLDLIVRALFRLGMTRKELGVVIGG